jgi:hypothetical protein
MIKVGFYNRLEETNFIEGEIPNEFVDILLLAFFDQVRLFTDFIKRFTPFDGKILHV